MRFKQKNELMIRVANEKFRKINFASQPITISPFGKLIFRLQ